MNKHYTLEEILNMEKEDEHIKSCNICLEIFKKKENFLEIFDQERLKLNKIKNNLLSLERAKKMLIELEETSPSLRIPKIIKKQFFSAYLILEICKKIKKLYFSKPKEAKNWFNIGSFILNHLENSEEEEVSFARGSLLLTSGNLKMFEGKLKDALEDFRKCLEIFEKERDDFHKALVIRSMLFPLNFKLEFGEAFSLSLEALRIFRDHGAKREMLYLWNNIGLIYLKKHRIERAENIFKILLKKLPSNDPYYALIYHNSLLVKMSKKEYQEILLSIEEFQKMARNADLKVEIGRSYIIEGETYIFLKDFPKAIKSLKKASKFLRGNLFSFDEAYINIGLAKAYFEQKNYEKAFIYLKKAYNFYSSEGFVEEIEQSLSLWEKGIKDRKKNIESLSNTIYSKLFNLYHFGIYYLEST